MQAGNRSRGQIGNMKKTIVLGMLLVILLVPGVQGQQVVNRCVNATNMVSQIHIIDKETNATVADWEIPTLCQFNCNNATGKCNAFQEGTTYYKAIGISLLILTMYLAYAIIKTRPGGKDGI